MFAVGIILLDIFRAHEKSFWEYSFDMKGYETQSYDNAKKFFSNNFFQECLRSYEQEVLSDKKNWQFRDFIVLALRCLALPPQERPKIGDVKCAFEKISYDRPSPSSYQLFLI